MDCTRCGTETGPDDLFCPSCGNPLTSACTRCGQALAPSDRFCRICGTPVVNTLPPPAAPSVNPWTPSHISQASNYPSPARRRSQVASPSESPSPYLASAPAYPAARNSRRVGDRRPLVPAANSQPAAVYVYKGIFPRFLAKVLDGFVIGLPLFLLSLIVVWATGYASSNDRRPATFLLSLLCVIFILLYIAFEGGGGTPGKRILGMRIVDAGGNKPGFGKALVRNLLGIVDFLPFAYIIGVIMVAASQTKQRLGDRVAGTYVIGRE